MVKMIALRDFPLAANSNASRRTVRKGDHYEIPADLVDFHTTTGRGKKAATSKKKDS